MILLVLPKEPAIRGMLLRCLDNRNHAVVCFKRGMGTGACPSSPLCLMNVSVFAEIPKVVNSLGAITVVWEPGQETM